MQLKVERKTVEVVDFAEASAIYDAMRSASGQGMRTFPDGEIVADGEPIARVSYNAKVWPVEPWFPGQQALFNPYAPVAPEMAS